jgi:hypothetical protein
VVPRLRALTPRSNRGDWRSEGALTILGHMWQRIAWAPRGRQGGVPACAWASGVWWVRCAGAVCWLLSAVCCLWCAGDSGQQ